MKRNPLVRHLAIALALKLLALLVLWWFFVRPLQLVADTAQTAEHLGARPVMTESPRTASGAQP